MKTTSFNSCIIVALSKRYFNELRGLQDCCGCTFSKGWVKWKDTWTFCFHSVDWIREISTCCLGLHVHFILLPENVSREWKFLWCEHVPACHTDNSEVCLFIIFELAVCFVFKILKLLKVAEIHYSCHMDVLGHFALWSFTVTVLKWFFLLWWKDSKVTVNN